MSLTGLRIRLGGMQRRPKKVSPEAQQLAELIDREVMERCGDDSTFEQRQEVAAAVVAEVMARRMGSETEGA